MPFVRLASPDDYDAILRLRDAFFARWHLPIQERAFEEPYRWVVAALHERIVAVLCTSTFEETAQIWCWDFYREESRWGTVGAFALASWLETEADAGSLEIICTTPPDNVEQILAATGQRVEVVPERDGRGYEILAVMYRRKSKGRA